MIEASMKNLLYRLAFVISMILWLASFYLLLSSHPYIPSVRNMEHGVHFVMFFGLAFMTTCAQKRPKIVLTLALLFLFGGISEIAQHFIPPRTCDPIDFAEDVVGSIAGLTTAMVWMTLLKLFLRSVFWKQLGYGKTKAVSHQDLA